MLQPSPLGWRVVRPLGDHLAVVSMFESVFAVVQDHVIVSLHRIEADANRDALKQFAQEIDQENRRLR